MKRRNLHEVILVDLADEKGQRTEETVQLTSEIFLLLQEDAGKIKFTKTLFPEGAGRAQVSYEDAREFQPISALCQKFNCDAILIGQVQALPAGKSVSFKIVNPQTRSAMGELLALLPLSAEKLLFWADPNAPDSPPFLKVDGRKVSFPKCSACPVPRYTEEARSRGYLGSVVLSVVISREGRAERIEVVRRAGHGLDEEAIEAVRKWKFQPAQDRAGNPVTVLVPIEVTFRLL